MEAQDTSRGFKIKKMGFEKRVENGTKVILLLIFLKVGFQEGAKENLGEVNLPYTI